MFGYLSHAIVGLSLGLASYVPSLARAPTVSAATAPHHCTKAHRHAPSKAAPKAVPRGAGVAQIRRSSDVQILAYGP